MTFMRPALRLRVARLWVTRGSKSTDVHTDGYKQRVALHGTISVGLVQARPKMANIRDIPYQSSFYVSSLANENVFIVQDAQCMRSSVGETLEAVAPSDRLSLACE